jgi:hypothetical protein
VRGESAPVWLADLGLAARLVSTSGGVLRVGDWPAPVAPGVPAPGPGKRDASPRP